MASVEKLKRTAGGSATAHGIDFQARVSAIVMAHLVAERPMGWLADVANDMPLELDAETGGPGDDLRFLTSDGMRVELQAKKGLTRDSRLWEALLSLAKGIANGCIDAGILAICPNSSGTIKEDLLIDIKRLGTGRTDGLRKISKAFVSRLTDESLDIPSVCRRIRIVIVYAVDGNQDSETTAKELLSRVTQDPQAAWKSLVEYSGQLIRMRGKVTPEQIAQKFFLDGILLKTNDTETRIQLKAAIREWLQKIYAQITISGVKKRVSFDDCWISLDANLLENGAEAHEELDKAIKHYHEYSYQHHKSEQSFNSHTIGRFIKKCIVLGGPGIGKSTLLKKLALEYSKEGCLTLFVRLSQLAKSLEEEPRFENCLVNLALNGSGIRVSPSISLHGAVVLCDGLDECGNNQPRVTAALHAFSVAHPDTRIIVSSRPIGYHPGEITDWRLYELQPLKETEAEEAISKILRAIPFQDDASRGNAIALAHKQLQAQSVQGVASRSPLMLTLMAALSAKGIDPGSNKAALYKHIFQIIEDDPRDRFVENPPSEPERNKFLDFLGWSLLSHENEESDKTLERCAKLLQEELNLSSLESRIRVRACFDYWECLGIVERVYTMSQEAITFVHKTFGEFAAARYIFECDVEDQRNFVTSAILKSEWKEVLSFASHLGLTPLILEEWIALTTAGNSKAEYSIDDAAGLLVQSGVQITENAIEGFAACCWKLIANSTSRARYAAGEALCIVSKRYWSVIHHDVRKRLEDPDDWTKLVAWACLSISPEQDIPFRELVDVLRDLSRLLPRDLSLGSGIYAPTSRAVGQHLILHTAERILQKGPDSDELKVLEGLLDKSTWLSVGAVNELASLFKKFGLELPPAFSHEWMNIDKWVPFFDAWNQNNAYFLELIDDPSMEVETDSIEDPTQYWELGAFFTASNWWETPISAIPKMSVDREAMLLKRMVVHEVAKVAGLDKKRLVRQARAFRQQINDKAGQLRFADLPCVDVDTQFEGVEENKIGELEHVILSEWESFFSENACKLLYGLHRHPGYIEAIERLLTNGRNDSLRISAILANSLPDRIVQPLFLKRLCSGEITSGCRYLFERLKPPFDAHHVDAVLRGLGLEGNLVKVAKAAADFASKLHLTAELAEQLRTHFAEWKTKEEPYPKGTGVIPDSPRDALAKILLSYFDKDEKFLISMAKDDRPGVRTAALEPILVVAATSPSLRKWIVQETALDSLEPRCLRTAIERRLYSNTEAPDVAGLLQSDIARVRFAALPILDTKYFSIEFVHAESSRLLSDDSIDIRKAARQILNSLDETKQHDT